MSTNVPGVNYENVRRWFAQQIEGGDCDLDFQLIGDGRSNITYLVRGNGNTWVMRRPPLGHVLPTAHDMAREFKVQSAVTKVGYPAPKMLALCEDPAVNEYPFYVMDFKDGIIIVADVPAGFAETPEARGKIGQALVDNMVRLHGIDYPAVGLGDFAHKPEAYLERQVRRWSEQWERSKTREIPEIDELIRRLRGAIPQSAPPTIVHGDYRLGNIIFNRDDPGKVEAVLDWEMSTLGDPIADLGYTLVYWGNSGDNEMRRRARPMSAITAQEGFWTREQIIAEYGRQTGRDVSNVDYYEVFANYKLAVITEGIYNRHTQGKTTFNEAAGASMAESAKNLIDLALAQADASPNPRLRGSF
ncbi:MAG: phosphotransferase family protein [Dehalococcoidia bacterium]